MKHHSNKTGEQARTPRAFAGRIRDRIAKPRAAARAFDPVAYAAVLEVLG